MVAKGKQISVIIAGATGSTGRNLVSRLVSHPDVSRVVALARHPIPVNRWTAVFPHLHSGDALRYLSVVPVDWIRVLADTSNVPSSYVSDGVWRLEDEAKDRERFLRHFGQPQRRRGGGGGGGNGSVDGSSHPLSMYAAMGSYSSSSSSASQAGSNSVWSSVSTVDSAVGTRPTGYVKFTPRSSFSARHEAAAAAAAAAASSSPGGGDDIGSSGSGGGAHFSGLEKMHDSQAFLQQLLHNSFYTSIFSGHHVAINCLGTSHMLSKHSVRLVDYELSIAFAKAIRLFNCMAHAEPSEDEERLLVETTSRELDSALWGEIYSACYGKKEEHPQATGAAGTQMGVDVNGGSRNSTSADSTTTADTTPTPTTTTDDRSLFSASVSPSAAEMEQMHRGKVATLRHFSQVSVRGANDHSPITYLRAHGRRDRDLLWIFNRRTQTFFSPSILHSIFLSSPMTHTVLGHDETAHYGRHNRSSTSGSGGGGGGAIGNSNGSSAVAADGVGSDGNVRFSSSPVRAMKNQKRRKAQKKKRQQQQRQSRDGTAAASPVVIRACDYRPSVWQSIKAAWSGKGDTNDGGHGSSGVHDGTGRSQVYLYDEGDDEGDDDGGAGEEGDAYFDVDGRGPDALARHRAHLLLRRDVVKIWEHASITIWRPGVLARPKPRLSEWLFSFLERSVDVRCLAECIVDDVMESLYRGGGNPGSVGSVKVINGKSVSRRAHMKAIEDGLNAEDTQGGNGAAGTGSARRRRSHRHHGCGNNNSSNGSGLDDVGNVRDNSAVGN